MPTLIVEDGTNVTNANSYIDLTYLASYASDRNYSLPTLDVDKEIFVIRGMDYLEGQLFNGSRTNDDQALNWPRQNVFIDCELFDEESIPELLKKALAQLVIEQQLRTPLYPQPRTSAVEGFVTEKTVGPLTKKFTPIGGMVSSLVPIKIASVEVFLRQLRCCAGSLETVRI